MKKVLVTGISGSGKSTACEILSEFGYSAHNIEELEGQYQAIDRTTGNPPINHDNDNLEKVKKIDWLCDVNKLRILIADDKEEFVFCCGGGANIEEMASLFDIVILLSAPTNETKRRLATRPPKAPGEPKGFGGTEEVQDWVMSKKEEQEEHLKSLGAIVVNADQSREKVVEDILRIVK